MSKEPIQMTARGLEKLKEELRYLKEDKRQELADYMGAALADGDLRESAAYDEARLLQSANEARIADLEELVHRAVVVEHEDGGEAVARLGASLTLRSQDGENVVFHLVGTHEADILEGRVSDESPLGRSLVGRRVGDDVTVQMPVGAAVYRVVAVTFD
ncbi:MAG: transcription elongation factor GreA [Trueperaceae bacterium]|nr:transcription elongation factor GreA [Trueperaceae bacterium]MCC6311180.1 transcription elongation factor GreA [Trueperaceae bacterium]MCO5174524.1 transcription elongation factor GreA [Trueperaceae bacterium]MCW5818887.1 transcription elongation factor GreA [Trueperaceae bacterium]